MTVISLWSAHYGVYSLQWWDPKMNGIRFFDLANRGIQAKVKEYK